MKLYLAGPMTGYPAYNFPAFHAAAAALRARGHDVWSPAERDEQEGFNPQTDTAHPLRYYMRWDLPAVLESDAVATLPGWEESVGANLEVHVAQVCAIPIYTIDALLDGDAQRRAAP